ncbi:MAG TPA: hypothetical protein VN327_17455 [Pseudonocardiaceae bacterium]|jgi:hypothetical protein|nr:hypothetical protein [Pseudonocardiaceae bacterium]
MLPDPLPGLAVRLDQLLRVVVDRTAHPSAARLATAFRYWALNRYAFQPTPRRCAPATA